MVCGVPPMLGALMAGVSILQVSVNYTGTHVRSGEKALYLNEAGSGYLTIRLPVELGESHFLWNGTNSTGPLIEYNHTFIGTPFR